MSKRPGALRAASSYVRFKKRSSAAGATPKFDRAQILT